jgi:aryl-alcohol dehydrogenase-like predicted oxidoreductase
MITTRPIGSLDMQVSVIGFGGASISGEGGGYGFGHITEDESLVLLRTSFERGITLFDTAPVYGFGMSEQRIGKALSANRDKIVIVSKGGVTWDNNMRIGIDNSPKVIQKMLERSLKDLSTDYIDVYMIHWPDKNIDIRKPMEYLSRAKDEKKILAIGLCNSCVDDIAKAFEVDRIEVLQSELNLFNSSTYDSLASTIREKKMGFMSWGTLDKGILTGRVTPDRLFDEVDARSWAPWWKKDDRSHKYRAMKRLGDLLRETNHSGLELALGYVLHCEEVSSALCGMRNTEQLESAINALHNLPGQDILDEAQSIVDEELNNRS